MTLITRGVSMPLSRLLRTVFTLDGAAFGSYERTNTFIHGISIMTYCVILLLFIVDSTRSDSEEEGADHENEKGKSNCPFQNQTCHHQDGMILKEMLDHYGDGSVRPGAPIHQADIVHCYLNVMSFHSVEDLTMDYTISFTLHSSWQDMRLAQNETESLVIRGRNIDKIWRPDLYFPLEKTHETHFVIGDDRTVRLLPNGEVWFSTKLTLTQACPMNFKTFPFDVQRCKLEIGSLGHFSNELQIKWGQAKHNAVEIHHVEDLSHFWLEVENLTSFNSTNWGQMYPLPYIRTTFVLTRRLEFHLLFYFFPTALLVLISWTNFFLDVQAVPARVALGITTILTMFTQIMTTRGSLPRVSYVTALDTWLFACLSFVILASFEYVLAHYVSCKPTRQKIPLTPSPGIEEDAGADSSEELDGHNVMTTNRLYAQTHVSIGKSSRDIPYVTNSNNHKKRKRKRPSFLETLCSMDARRSGCKTPKKAKVKREEKTKKRTNHIDTSARIVFPASFLAFTLIYFYCYLWPLDEVLRHVGHYKGPDKG